MQIRSRAYLHMVSRLRALRMLLKPSAEPAAREASPLLIYVAVVLALVLAMLEVDLHSSGLLKLGLAGGPFPAGPVFAGP